MVSNTNCKVFRIKSTDSDDEPGRPEAHPSDPRNQGIEWQRAREVITLRDRSFDEYLPLAVYLNHDNPGEWHAHHFQYLLLSSAVREVIENLPPGRIRWLPATVNGLPYFISYFSATLDVLDKNLSEIRFPLGPSRSGDVNFWAFRHERLIDPEVFTVPETIGTRKPLFVTASIAKAIHARKFKGIDIFCAEGYDKGHPKWRRSGVEELK